MTRLGVAAIAVATALVVAGCGGPSPVQEVPALEQRLADVDAAAASGDPAALESAVESLVATVDEAESADQLDADHAGRIRDAAEALLAAVPEPDQPVDPPPSRSEEPTEKQPDESDESADDEDDESDHGDGGGGKSQGKAKGKHKDKGKDKD